MTLTQTFRGRLRRLYKRTYPWINIAFEGWLMAYNVAYAFERTPFYRPWLSWVGVDLRRLGVEDLVSMRAHFEHVSTYSGLVASSSSCDDQGKAIGERRQTDIRSASPPFSFTSTASRFAQVAASNGHIFHQISRVVVLPIVSCSRSFDVAARPRHPSPSLTPTPSKRDIY